MSASAPLHAAGSSHGHGHGDHGHGHHIHGPLDQAKALKVQSLGFEPIFNEKYNESRVASETTGFLFLQRFLPLVIGLVTAGTAVVVGMVSEKLGDFRTTNVHKLIMSHGWAVAWLTEFAIMTAMALIGGFFVYFGKSTETQGAGSSGIPQLIALLNGCDLRNDFRFRNLLVKWFGVSLAVASGLAVGPEGPMIFIGSAVGFMCSRLPQSRTVWKILGTPPRTVGDDVFTRDYTSIGAACGIAAAFRAPIAGTLFIVEEAASHFKKEQMSNIFFGGLASLEVILITGGAGAVLEYKVQTGPGCSSTPWWTFLFLVGVGLICGLAGALFNDLNIRVMTFRARRCNATMPMRRAAELVILCLLSSAAWLVAASLFGEVESTSAQLFPQSNGCLKDNWKNQLITGAVIEKQGDDYLQKLNPKPCLYGAQYDATACPQVFLSAESGNPYAKSCLDAIQTDAIKARPDSKSYCCAFNSLDELSRGIFQVPANASCPLDLGEGAPSLTPEDEGATFNGMGMLSLVPFKVACQNLFTRGIPHLISLPAMCLFLVLFFVASAITAGAAIPSGLLMPQMVIGGAIGRICAVLVMKAQIAWGMVLAGGHETSVWTSAFNVLLSNEGGPLASDAILTQQTAGYLDPGIGALIGAAAFLGGSGRVTLFTTVMMVEITGDPVMIFPVGFATIFAVLMGNYLNHGLYHALLDVQSQPYLPDNWQMDQLPPGIVVADMMPRNDPIVVPVEGGKEGIHRAIDGNPFSGFPLVNEDGAVIGLCERKYLEDLLKKEGEVSAEELKKATDMYPLTVRQNFPLQSAYQLFKSMDMKNLVVVDNNHKPLAVMTRFAFLAWRVAERLGDKLGELQEIEEERLKRSRSQRSNSIRSINLSMQARSSGSNGSV